MLGSRVCARTKGDERVRGNERVRENQKGTQEVKVLRGLQGTIGGRRLGALDRNLGRRRSSLVLATLAENMPATAS